MFGMDVELACVSRLTSLPHLQQWTIGAFAMESIFDECNEERQSVCNVGPRHHRHILQRREGEVRGCLTFCKLEVIFCKRESSRAARNFAQKKMSFSANDRTTHACAKPHTFIWHNAIFCKDPLRKICRNNIKKIGGHRDMSYITFLGLMSFSAKSAIALIIFMESSDYCQNRAVALKLSLKTELHTICSE